MGKKTTELSALRKLALRLQGLLGETAQAAADAADELDRTKAPRARFQTAILPAGAWTACSEAELTAAGYTVSCTLALEQAAAGDGAECILAPAAMAAAGQCGLCPSVTVAEGALRFYAQAAPESDLPLQVRLIQAEKDKEGAI